MPLSVLWTDKIAPLELAIASLGFLECQDLHRLIRDRIEALVPKTLVGAEEFSRWEKSDRRIDLLAEDEQARVIVVKLKRTTDGSFADLQAFRYASMVFRMTFDGVIDRIRRVNEWCGLHFWSDSSLTPVRFSNVESAKRGRGRQFSLNVSGFEQFIWNCRVHQHPTNSVQLSVNQSRAL